MVLTECGNNITSARTVIKKSNGVTLTDVRQHYCADSNKLLAHAALHNHSDNNDNVVTGMTKYRRSIMVLKSVTTASPFYGQS